MMMMMMMMMKMMTMLVYSHYDNQDDDDDDDDNDDDAGLFPWSHQIQPVMLGAFRAQNLGNFDKS